LIFDNKFVTIAQLMTLVQLNMQSKHIADLTDLKPKQVLKTETVLEFEYLNHKMERIAD